MGVLILRSVPVGSAPVNTVAPVVSGTARVGSTLSCSTGSWDNTPTSYTYQWLRDGDPISGATSATYQLQVADEGADISCAVTASNSTGSASQVSNEVGPVEEAEPESHPNEPAGHSLIVNRAFLALDEDGWADSDGTNSNAAYLTLSDGIMRHNFPPGHPGSGSSSRTTRNDYGVWPSTESVYLDIRCRFSSNWYGQDGSGVNKILYIGDTLSNPIVLDAHGIGSAALRLRVALQGGETTNLNYNTSGNGVSPSASDAEIVRGAWTRITLLYKNNTPGSANGEIHAWVNDVKTHQFTGVNIHPSGANLSSQWLHVHPIYGGGGGTAIPELQYIDYDRYYVSTK